MPIRTTIPRTILPTRLISSGKITHQLPISIGPFTLAKTKIQKTWVFCCTVYTARKTHNIRVFGTKNACAKKPESHTCVLVSGAHARLLSTFDRTRVVRITSRAVVGWFRWRSHTTWPKTWIIPCEDWSRRLHWQKNPEKPAELATSHEKPECTKDSGYLMQV